MINILEPEQKIPLNIKVLDENGKVVTLDQYLGQPLLIYFYPRDFTAGCTQEAEQFREYKFRLNDYGVKILGVSTDSPESHREFKKQFDLNFQLLSDPKKQLHKAFGVWQEKRLFGKSFMGTVRSTFLTDHKGQIKQVWPHVKVENHVHEVLDYVANQLTLED
jgi:peroxiredoxin